jgi:hypothetical protein
MLSGFIDDAYTLDGYFKELPEMYAAIRFKFRPLTQTERSVFFDGWDQMPVESANERAHTTLAAHITSWDLKNSKGAPVSCREQAFSKLCPALYDRLFAVVFQRGTCDPDPEKAKSKDAEGFAESDAAKNSTGV